MERIVDLIILFFAYSFAGWCIEVILKYRQFHRFINRGFFAGPILPIYGSGAALITVTVGALSGVESSYGTTFIVSFFLCGTVEYLTSWFMEKRYHARWWDYSQKPMNLNGRVWIGNLLLFGIAGVAIINLLNPMIYGVLNRIDPVWRRSLAIALMVVFAADYVMSHFVMKLVKTGVEKSEADNTEEIGREIRLMLSDRTIFHKRFADAYPEVIYRTDRIQARLEAIRAENERLRREAERRIDAMNQKLGQSREQLAEALEPSYSIRSTLIKDQEKLIALLYDDAAATEDMRAIKRDIDKNRERLKNRVPHMPGRVEMNK